jgi:hypothetical protein
MIFEVCIKDNQHKTTFSNDGWRWVTTPLEIMHSNICDPHEDDIYGRYKIFCQLHQQFFKEGVNVDIEV